MNLVRVNRPRVFILGMANRVPSRLPYIAFIGRFPVGQNARVNFILMNYPRVVVGTTQTSPDLSMVMLSMRGREYMGTIPLPALLTTTPAGARSFSKSQFVGLEFAGGEVVEIRVTGFAAGPSPSSVSLALHCQLGASR